MIKKKANGYDIALDKKVGLWVAKPGGYLSLAEAEQVAKIKNSENVPAPNVLRKVR
jgi:hypothetical protein